METVTRFNPRAPCGARHVSDLAFDLFEGEFQSTRPVWGATEGTQQNLCLLHVSIHAPRVGRDLSFSIIVKA